MKADMDRSIRMAYERTRKAKGLGRWPVPSQRELEPVEYKLVPAKLRAYREAKGWRLTDVVEMCGINKSSYQAWESGQRSPRRDMIFDIADKLGCYVWEIAEEGT